MKIESDKVVELIYTLVVDGEVADQTTEERPLDFIFGTGSLLPKFEENILNKEPGDAFEFVLSAADGYGEVEEQAIVKLPISIFQTDGQIQEGLLTIGNTIPMMNNMGNVMHGVVKEVSSEFVTMDFNHPMAGKVLNFSGKILTVRDATDQEMIDGLHGERKAHSCGEGGCSSCSGCH